jgi:Protein of unknown function (DUF3499)
MRTMLRAGRPSASLGRAVDTFSPVTRSCARPACSQPAAATLSYDYDARSAWIDLLDDEAHPMRHDLCGPHADQLSVPVGWDLDDRRVAVAPLFRESIAS